MAAMYESAPAGMGAPVAIPTASPAPTVVSGCCPTGALHYTLRDGEPEHPSVPARIRLPEGGPLLLEGDLELEGRRETRAAICRCGQSENQPYCDRSGPCRQWRYEPDR